MPNLTCMTKFDQESFLEDLNDRNFEYLNENMNDVNAKFLIILMILFKKNMSH